MVHLIGVVNTGAEKAMEIIIQGVNTNFINILNLKIVEKYYIILLEYLLKSDTVVSEN
jgi:hypothetical protein